ncbi:MAG TPA: nuclear transport factor 2 family protein [Bacteroidales bacterium]|nr:nuclear transport factor 2 family protein [Bacteroidales bacterium]HPS17869.1 nuclear transport factor 2 family protein [Bacteroidales bacterium]
MANDNDKIIEFVKHINNHNVEEIAAFLSDDHCFIDAYGQNIIGKDKMKKAWEVYFDWFPDYVINISEIIAGSQCTAMFGYASGTYKGAKDKMNSNYWRLPSAWKIIVENNKIKHWQVYCDTKIPNDRIQNYLKV